MDKILYLNYGDRAELYDMPETADSYRDVYMAGEAVIMLSKDGKQVGRLTGIKSWACIDKDTFERGIAPSVNKLNSVIAKTSTDTVKAGSLDGLNAHLVIADERDGGVNPIGAWLEHGAEDEARERSASYIALCEMITKAAVDRRIANFDGLPMTEVLERVLDRDKWYQVEYVVPPVGKFDRCCNCRHAKNHKNGTFDCEINGRISDMHTTIGCKSYEIKPECAAVTYDVLRIMVREIAKRLGVTGCEHYNDKYLIKLIEDKLAESGL